MRVWMESPELGDLWAEALAWKNAVLDAEANFQAPSPVPNDLFERLNRAIEDAKRS